MKPVATAIFTALAAVCAAQETRTLDELQAEREQLQQRLDENRAAIEQIQTDGSKEEDEALRQWQQELQKDLDEVGEYLDEVPRELSKYYVSMQEALGDLLVAIEEGLDETRAKTREKIAAAERRYWGARETAYNQDRLHELRERAEELDAADQAAPLIESFEKSLAAVETAQADAAAAEAELERARKAADLAGRKLELRLLEIETQRLEESLNTDE